MNTNHLRPKPIPKKVLYESQRPAKAEGRKAYEEGVKLKQNPYPKGSQENADWEDGWEDGEWEE